MSHCTLWGDLKMLVRGSHTLFPSETRTAHRGHGVKQKLIAMIHCALRRKTLEESVVLENSVRDMHRAVVHECTAAFQRDLAAKRAAAGMWFSTGQMWDAVANAIQAKLLLDYLRVRIQSVF